MSRILTLVKPPHKYAFRYQGGGELEVIDQIMRLAEDDGCNLDWFDAAMLSFQVAHGVACDCAAALSCHYQPSSLGGVGRTSTPELNDNDTLEGGTKSID
jgi:hypothetical protein